MKLKYIILLFVLIAGFLGYNYVYKGHRDISSEVVFETLTAVNCVSLFQQNENPDILNQTIQVTGVLTAIENQAITLDNVVYCSFDTLPSDLKVGNDLVIKGRCIGYDDLFEIVKLDQSTIIN